MEEYGRWEADSVSGGKFWSISRDGTNVTTSWGKLGSSGQSNTKSFASEEKAVAMITSTILKKEKEGYVKQGGKKRKDVATHSVPVVNNSDETLDTVSLPGAAFPLFELQSFEFTLGEDGKTFTFQFSTKEVKRKIGKEDEDEDEEEEKEDEEEEEGGDWKSRSAWENYGPGCSMEHDFGTLTSKRKVDLKKLPTEVQFADDEDGSKCCLFLMCMIWMCMM